MHIDHDHIVGSEHSHQDIHAHDGHTHTHKHVHEEHTHSHEHPHEAGRDHIHRHTPVDELLALMKYMVGHNAAHTKELTDLAAQLKDAGSEAAYEKVMSAVADFDKGNKTLADVLKEMDAE